MAIPCLLQLLPGLLFWEWGALITNDFSASDDVYSSVPVYLPPESSTSLPIIVWWTPFTADQRIVKQCSVGDCLFTHSRTEQANPNTTAFLFYGTFINWTDLPLPRRPTDLWALLHEESPKNNWLLAHDRGISLFNLTSTPSRRSSYPLSTQYLRNLEELAAPVWVPTAKKSTGDIGLVIYIQSDCNPPSDRDSYVWELMKYVKVDSYGECLHNRDLPDNLTNTLSFDTVGLYNIQAQYKFTLSFENARCNDYITEKVWRPLYIGSVPIVRGSPTVKDWAPDKKYSIINADEFSNPKDLAAYLKHLDEHDDEYEKYLEFKRTGVTNDMLLRRLREREWVVGHEGQPIMGTNFVDGFQCFVCDEIHRRKRLIESGHRPPQIIANRHHFDCQEPKPALANMLSGATANEETEGMSEVAIRDHHFWQMIARCSEKRAEIVYKVVSGELESTGLQKLLDEACIDFHV